MELTSVDGVRVELSPLRYQFGSAGEPRDWDANWLVVAGHVELSDGRSWSFVDPCLTTWEARELGSWLRGVREGRVPPTAFDGEEDAVSLVFTEPDIAFSLAGRDVEGATVRVHLSLGSLPPWLLATGRPDLFEFFVDVRLTHAALASAGGAWERELAAFPVR